MPMARGMSQMLSSRIVGQSASLDKAEEDLDMSLDNLNQMILELDPTFEPLPVRSHTTNKSLNKGNCDNHFYDIIYDLKIFFLTLCVSVTYENCFSSHFFLSCQSLLSDDNDSCLDSNLFSPHDPLTDDSHTNRTFTPMQNQGVSLLHPNTCPPLMGVSLTDIPVVLVNGTPVPSLSPVVNVNQNFHTRSGSRSPSPQDKTFCLNSRQKCDLFLLGFVGSKSNMKFVMDTSQYWFRPQITREEADALLRDQEPGSFVVRDSTSYKGSFDLAMKVPTNPTSLCKAGSEWPENSSEHIKHFLIESSVKGVRVKGSSQEQYFGSLSALIYQHTISAYALPSKLVICSQGSMGLIHSRKISSNFLFLSAVPVEMLTGSCAVQRAVSIIFKSQADQITPTIVNLMVSPKGMTLTDIQRKLFGIITKGTEPGAENVCHVFAEYNPSQLCSSILHLIQRITAKSQI
uniref:SH2 domain-containing protein n=1 Tax=Denticeps clupeoides TaxID=299321 RepID=A0AAY4DE48_9TELE